MKTLAKEQPGTQLLKNTLIFCLGLSLMFVAGELRWQTPWSPVPITSQTLMVLFVAYYFRAQSLSIVSAYVFINILERPFPTLALVLPTYGYFLGMFLAAIYLKFYFSKNRTSFLQRFWGSFVAHNITLFFGTIALSQSIGLDAALRLGFVFFIPVEIIKSLIFASATQLKR